MRNEHKNKLPFNYLSSQIQHKFRWNRCSHILHWEITFHEFSPNYVSYTRHSNEMFTLFNFWVNNLQKVKQSERERERESEPTTEQSTFIYSREKEHNFYCINFILCGCKAPKGE